MAPILPEWAPNRALAKVKRAPDRSLSGYELSQAWTEQRSAGPDIKFAARRVLHFRFRCQRTVGHYNVAQISVRTEGAQAFGARDMRDGGRHPQRTRIVK